MVSFIVAGCIKTQKQLNDPQKLVKSAIKKLREKSYNSLCDLIERRMDYYEKNANLKDIMKINLKDQLMSYMQQQLVFGIYNITYNPIFSDN